MTPLRNPKNSVNYRKIVKIGNNVDIDMYVNASMIGANIIINTRCHVKKIDARAWMIAHMDMIEIIIDFSDNLYKNFND